MSATFDQALREFVGRVLAAQRAVDQVLEEHQNAPKRTDQVLGDWIHFGPCGGKLVRLQGLRRPVCTKCAKEVR
jgi:hypothetical protein